MEKETWRDRFEGESGFGSYCASNIPPTISDEMLLFIQSEIDKALAEQKSGIVEMLENMAKSERDFYGKTDIYLAYDTVIDKLNNLK